MGIAERMSDFLARRGVSIRELKLLGGVVLVGVVLRGCYLAEISQAPDFTSPGMDAAYHDHWARGLAFGDWSLPPEYPDPQIRTTPYFRPPGYPHFLALVYALAGPSYVGPRIVQMLMGLASSVLAYVLARRLFGVSVGLLTALFMSLYWAFIYFEGELLAPGLLVLLTLLLLNVVVRWSDEPTWLR
ncbi:MAG: glycosyltransferase family 39 protein, partial [Planctomycetes bacterium]|nr:glycosyltransferase family 39 protein [Planctomycetota bacterium]